MPLIFSTYKIKLGGIIPTANLFSRFLEKNVEQAVDVFGFHANPYAHLLFPSWQQVFQNSVDEASSSKVSQAFPFWSELGYAQHLNKQDSPCGQFSAYERPVLFLPLWHESSWLHPFTSGVGDFKSQAAYGDAHQFYTQYGHQPYELVFDGTRTDGVEGRFGQAHPFWSDIGLAPFELVFDYSHNDGVLGRNGISHPFFSEIGWGLTPVYDESRTGESFLAANRLEPEFYAFANAAQNLHYLNLEESAIGSYASYDPFIPDSYLSGPLARFIESKYDITRVSQSAANSFYLLLEEALDYPFLHPEESSKLNSFFKFETYWIDSYLAQQLKLQNSNEESGADKFGSFYFWFNSRFYSSQREIKNAIEYGEYKQDYIYNTFWHDTYTGSKSYDYKNVAETEIARLGNYPLFHYKILPGAPLAQYLEPMVAESEWRHGRQYIEFFHDKNEGVDDFNSLVDGARPAQQSLSMHDAIPFTNYTFQGELSRNCEWSMAESSRFSLAQPFYYFLNSSVHPKNPSTGSGTFSALRRTQFFWHYNYTGAGVKHRQIEDSAVGRKSYYDIYYNETYQGTNVTDTTKVLPASLKTSFGAEPIYISTFAGINFPDAYGWMTAMASVPTFTPYIGIQRNGSGLSSKAIPAPAEASSNELPASIGVAYQEKQGQSSQLPFNNESEWNDVASAVAINNAYKTIFSQQTVLISRAALAYASGDFPADLQPYYVKQVTGNIDSDLFPYSSDDVDYVAFGKLEGVVTKDAQGERYIRDRAQTLEMLSGSGAGFEIIYDLHIIPYKLRYADSVLNIPKLTANSLKPTPFPSVLEYYTIADAMAYPDSPKQFNVKANTIDERDFWVIIPMTFLGDGFKRVSMLNMSSPAQFLRYADFEPSPIVYSILGQSSQNIADHVTPGGDSKVSDLRVQQFILLSEYNVSSRDLNVTSIEESTSLKKSHTEQYTVYKNSGGQRNPNLTTVFLMD